MKTATNGIGMTRDEYLAIPEDLRPRGAFVVVGAWSGNVKPFRADAYLDGKYIGSTGFCISEDRAREAAAAIFGPSGGVAAGDAPTARMVAALRALLGGVDVRGTSACSWGTWRALQRRGLAGASRVGDAQWKVEVTPAGHAILASSEAL